MLESHSIATISAEKTEDWPFRVSVIVRVATAQSCSPDFISLLKAVCKIEKSQKADKTPESQPKKYHSHRIKQQRKIFRQSSNKRQKRDIPIVCAAFNLQPVFL
uniref:Uncharacterized protein n=1 Tax=Strigamia maritima TaxID=126957 RepID=T1JJQ9_STRMM